MIRISIYFLLLSLGTIHIFGQNINPGELVINEFMANNGSTASDQGGEFDDWIELYNTTDSSLNLSGLFMTDNPALPTKWPVPDTTIPPNGYLIVWADDDTAQAGLHAYFRLAGSGEFLWIGYPTGVAVDFLSFGAQAQDISFGRFPNGTGNFQMMPPTFSSVNVTFSIPVDTLAPGTIVINEFMAENNTTIADQNGEFDDWIELYNTTENVVSLSHVFLSDNIFFPGQWAFPDTVIAPNGYLMIWADNNGSQPGLHANFRLSAIKEQLFLGYPDGTPIDSLSFGTQIADTTFGRYPNGSGPFGRMLPTFSAQNSEFVVATGIEDEFPGIEIRLYPNPADDFLSLQTSIPITSTLRLYDLGGRLMMEKRLVEQTEMKMDLSPMQSGFYLVRLGNKAYGKLLIR